MAGNRNFKKFHLIKALSLLAFNNKTWKPMLAMLGIGISIGIGFEETVGIGTWHKFQAETDKINVCFTPPSGCGSLIAQQISQAKKSIFVQAYGLTSSAVIHQLIQARARGIRVAVLLDGGNLSDNRKPFEQLEANNIFVAFDKMPGIAHNKIMIIDEKKIITGSFNFTAAADNKNAENVVLIEDSAIARLYKQNWDKRAKAARKN